MQNTTELITPEAFMDVASKLKDHHYSGLDLVNKRTGCPVRYENATPDTMDEHVKQWFMTTSGKGSLYVHGTVGTGKTHSITALKKLLYVNRVSAKTYTLIGFLDDVKSMFNYDDGEAATRSMMSTDKVLILDDFGAEKVTDWTAEVIYRLVNIRYEKMLQTFFISNLSTKELSGIYGDRIVSRIIEMVGGKDGIIKIEGKDRRVG
jgi:DNA replication protein DnaC